MNPVNNTICSKNLRNCEITRGNIMAFRHKKNGLIIRDNMTFQVSQAVDPKINLLIFVSWRIGL